MDPLPLEPERGVRGAWTLLQKVRRGSAGVKLEAVLKRGQIRERLHVLADHDHGPSQGKGPQ